MTISHVRSPRTDIYFTPSIVRTLSSGGTPQLGVRAAGGGCFNEYEVVGCRIVYIYFYRLCNETEQLVIKNCCIATHLGQ
jgi:hypothetical protein